MVNLDVPWLCLGWSLRETKGRLGRATTQPSTPPHSLDGLGKARDPEGLTNARRNTDKTLSAKYGQDPLDDPSCPRRLRAPEAQDVPAWGLGAELESRWRELNHSAGYGGT